MNTNNEQRTTDNTPLRILFIGLSITSSWGNGHATTYRALIRELHRAGHSILFLEKDVPWYAENRDMTDCSFCRIALYKSNEELFREYEREVREADLVVVGSYVQQGVEVGEWVITTARGLTAFYDIDTPVTLAKLEKGDHEYLSPYLIPRFHLYLSFTGGPVLAELEGTWCARRPRALYCSVDPALYYPEETGLEWDLGYLGTYSVDRQPGLERLMFQPARLWRSGRFVVAGPQYPGTADWPENVQYINHLPPSEHRWFYNRQRFTLNLTRQDMIKWGYAPSVRLFEAAACGVPVISDNWKGLSTFFRPGLEILIAESEEEALDYLTSISDSERRWLADNARQAVLSRHTAANRAEEFIRFYQETLFEVGSRKSEVGNDFDPI